MESTPTRVLRLISRARRRLERLRAGDGIFATKLGYNPNSSSLGVDVTFLLFGISSIAILTPVISLLLRGRGGKAKEPAQETS